MTAPVSNILAGRSISAKLTAVFGAVLVVVVGLGAFSISRITAVNAGGRLIGTEWLPAIEAKGELADAANAYRHAEATLLLSDEDYEVADARKDLLLARKRVERAFAVFGTQHVVTEETEYRADLLSEWADYMKLSATLSSLVDAGKRADATDAFTQSGSRVFRTIGLTLGRLLAVDLKGSGDSVAMADTTFRRAVPVMAGVTALAALLCVAAAFGVATWISRPVRQISDALGKLAAGDLGIAVADTGRRDEIGVLAGAVRVFRASMAAAAQASAAQSAEAAAKAERADRLAYLVGNFEVEISAFLGTLSAASVELETTAESMTAGAAATAEQASTASNAAEQASVGVEAASAAARQLSTAAAEISRSITQSASATGQAAQDTQRTEVIVRNLAESVEKVERVATLIADIAKQTNLLALNATIEAARAGASGRGFSVVASEVKALAKQTSIATEEVRGQITHIQSATQNAIAAIGSVDVTIREVDAIAAAIATAVEQQGVATVEIVCSVQTAATSTQQVTRFIAGVDEGATGTSTAASQVLHSARDLSKRAGRLAAEVTTFVGNVRAA